MGKRKGSLGKTPGLDFLTVIALIAGIVGIVNRIENRQCSDDVSTGNYTERNYME